MTPDAPLDMPAPPPRDVETDRHGTAAAAAARAGAGPERSSSSAAGAARITARRAAETGAAEARPARRGAKPTEEAPRPPTTLQTTPPTAEGEVERGIRASLVHATADLNRIDYRALNNDARTQYDTAKRFVDQAESAMRAKNLVFAKTVADKAAALAAQLAGR